MAQHRAEESYVPLKTATVVLWFVGLLSVIVVGMNLGNKFSVFPSPLFGPFPTAQSPVVQMLLPAPVVPSTEEAVPTPTDLVQEAATVISLPTAVSTRASQPSVRASEAVRTPAGVTPSAPVSVVENPVISTPDPVVEEPIIATPPVVTEEPKVEEPVVTNIPPTTTPEEPVTEDTPAPEETETTTSTE